MIPDKLSIEEAHNRIKPYIHTTPLLQSKFLTQQSGAKSFYMKCQNLQKIGAFKARGACNTLLKLKQKLEKQGKSSKNHSVCTHSSGNHAMALAYMSSILGFTAYIVMPHNSSSIKKKAVKSYGGIIIQSGTTVQERQGKCKQICDKYEATLVHPYDDYNIIEGQGTWAKQVFDELKNTKNQLDYIIFPIGGGGLGSGTVLTAKYFSPNCKVIGVEPYLARDAFLSLKQGQRHKQFPPITIADGLRVNLGIKPYQILSKYLSAEEVILVSDQQIVQSMRIVYERMKLVIQPSSASAIAAILKEAKKEGGGRFKNKNICCIITGGNIDLTPLFLDLQDKINKHKDDKPKSKL